MRLFRYLPAAVLAVVASVLPCARLPAAAATSLYEITKVVPLGTPDRWDYLTYDETSHRVYIAHESSIAVVDGRSGKALGQIAIPGANGIAVIPSLGKGYAGSRSNKTVVVFDLATLKTVKELPADDDTDGVVYDPASRRVFIMDGDPHNITVVDSTTDTTVTRVPLAGKPEFAAIDGRGKLFVNITDRKLIQRIDTKTLKVDATWPIAECEGPHGLSMDTATRRLFASCINSRLLVVDADDGKVLASLHIGKGSDAAGFDSNSKRIFSSNGEGTLSVIHEDGADTFVPLAEVRTQPLARTMAIDSQTGRIFLVAADRVEVNPAATDPRKRYAITPGSVRLLFADPTPPGK
jgi:DNA-binding beta-propeller fold protein YncE